MNSIDKLADVLVNSIKKPDNKPKPKPYDTPAEVRRVEGDTAFVHIPGGVDETPVKLTINAKVGDSVQVRVSGGRAFLVGNASSPPTDDSRAIYVQKKVVELNDSFIENSNIVNAEIINLKARDSELDQAIVIQSNIVKSEIYNSQIEDFTVINGVVQGLKATDAEISGKISAAEADIGNLKANKADISELEANYAHITNGVIDNAKIGYADVNDLNAHYANIDLANVNNAWIQNGVIKDAAITDAQIIGVGANKITAGVIDASKITVTNLNADNITAGTINGQRIGTGSLSLDKLAEEVPTKEYLDDLADDLQGQIDGQIETWTGTTVPTLNNAPAVDWNGDAKKLKAHVGDIYYVVNAANDADGYTYRFTESGSGSSAIYSWTLIKDNQITKALQEIQEAKGDISGIKQFDSEITSWKTDTDEELSSLKGRTTTLETDMGTKVSTQTFNELSQTVDGNTASISSLSETVDTKADGSAVQTLSNTVNTITQTANSNSSKISSLTTTLGTNADGTTKDGDIAHRTSAVEQKADSISTEVAKKTDKDTIISTIRQSAESVKIKASQVEIDGATTFNAIKASADAAYDAKGAASDAVGDLVDDLESASGTTVINGGHIETNSIGANKIKVNELTIGQSQVDGLSTALDGKQPTGDYATNSQAQGYASTAETNSKSYADAKKTEAVNAAATDATTKANNAKDAAISAAATDATNKANSAKANAKKEATNYIYAGSGGIKIANADPEHADTYQKQTSDSTEFYVDGVKRSDISGNGMRVYDNDGVESANFGATGFRMGAITDGETRLVGNGRGIDLIRRDGTSDSVLAHFGYDYGTPEGEGQPQVENPYYTFGYRLPNYDVGNWSVAEGTQTVASGFASHAEGKHTVASEIYSHAEGYYTEASGVASHAEGYYTVASDHYSHAEGYYTEASSNYSHAEGYHTIAGLASHAEGYYTEASSYAHAEGYHTIAHNTCHVEGQYNVEDTNEKYAHIIGNGSSEGNRSNALTVDWDGTIRTHKNSMKTLLTAADYMGGNQDFAFSEPVSEQLTGIVLVWSWWSGSHAEDWGWETFFIPKAMVQLHNGVGYDCPLSRPKSSYFGHKYVYIHDTHIVGHADNVATGKANGVPYANNKWVLRYVFGC